jgi:hypothetical protein
MGLIHQQAFDKFKKVIGTEVLPCYPDLKKPFHLYTYNKKPIPFYSRKLNTAQKQYTTPERENELLSAIETCKEYKNILLGYPSESLQTIRIIPSMA